MTKLHELLAVEKTRANAAAKLLQETSAKFQKSEMFSGHIKTLAMIEESAQNAALEQAAHEQRELPTTVSETLEYALDHWVKAEDVIMQKNCINQVAVADLMYDGKMIASSVPVDELISEVKQARMRANNVDAVKRNIGQDIVDLILKSFK